MPEIRIKNQAYNSKLLVGRTRCLLRLANMTHLLAPENRLDRNKDGWDGDQNRQRQLYAPQNPVEAAVLWPKVYDDDPGAIERVVDHGKDQPGFQDAKRSGSVEIKKRFKRFFACRHQKDVENVEHQEQYDAESGHAMEYPGPLPLPTSIAKRVYHRSDEVSHTFTPF